MPSRGQKRKRSSQGGRGGKGGKGGQRTPWQSQYLTPDQQAELFRFVESFPRQTGSNKGKYCLRYQTYECTRTEEECHFEHKLLCISFPTTARGFDPKNPAHWRPADVRQRILNLQAQAVDTNNDTAPMPQPDYSSEAESVTPGPEAQHAPTDVEVAEALAADIRQELAAKLDTKGDADYIAINEVMARMQAADEAVKAAQAAELAQVQQHLEDDMTQRAGRADYKGETQYAWYDHVYKVVAPGALGSRDPNVLPTEKNLEALNTVKASLVKYLTSSRPHAKINPVPTAFLCGNCRCSLAYVYKDYTEWKGKIPKNFACCRTCLSVAYCGHLCTKHHQRDSNSEHLLVCRYHPGYRLSYDDERAKEAKPNDGAEATAPPAATAAPAAVTPPAASPSPVASPTS